MTIVEEDVTAARESDDKLKKSLQQREAAEASAKQALEALEQLSKDLQSQKEAE